MQKYNVTKRQNLYDVAIAIHGSVEGIFDLLVNNPDLSFDTVLEAGDELNWDEDFVINSDIVDTLENELHIVPANDERNVYYKECDKVLRCVIKVDIEETSLPLSISGDGNMIVDWGDNSELEIVVLQPTLQKYEHYFDNQADSRTVKIYGDFNVKTWDLSTMRGAFYLMQPMTVDEVVCKQNSLSFQSLFLFKGTYSVELNGIYITDLDFIKDMSLSDLKLSQIQYENNDIIDEYLIYIAQHNNQRRSCKVILDQQPSGIYQEPVKDSNGKYIFKTGMEAIYVITHEDTWNESGAWEFDINGTVYKYKNNNIA